MEVGAALKGHRLEVNTEQAHSIDRTATGRSPGAVEVVESYPALRKLAGRNRDLISNGFEGYVGASFPDALGYEPESSRANTCA